MNIRLAGIGLWTRGLTSFRQVQDGTLAVNKDLNEIPDASPYVMPTPAAIPARERRRAGHFISLAVEVAHQACDMAGIDKSTIPSVFASAIGDTDITDYMCRKLTQAEKLLSPTQFHNSVHNAASGYWSISAGNRAPSTFVGGFDRSFGAGLLEAASQVVAFDAPVLLVTYDLATRSPFREMLAIDDAAGVALVLVPAHFDSTGADALSLQMTIELRTGAPALTGEQPENNGHAMSAALDLVRHCAALLGSSGNGRPGTSAHSLCIDTPRTGHLEVRLSRELAQ